jgi:CXXX repeat peptide maturase
MLQYLIILLDDTATSYCHYNNDKTEQRLITLDDLKAGILFAMKQNLMIQFVYPSYNIPDEYKKAIEIIDHVKIMPSDSENIPTADVVIFNSCAAFSAEKTAENKDKIFVLRASGRDAARHISTLENVNRLNISITDIDTFKKEDFEKYKNWLLELGESIKKVYSNGKAPQINLLTDRIVLEKMNNCNAGIGNITLAPNGKFYVCPAFYIENEEDSIGELKTDLDIKNKQLYKLEYAPLCRICDAYQCKRCVWLNRKTTLEVNTPSREQCVVAHLERNASEKLLNELKPAGYFPDKEIPAIDYLDPFLVIND